MDCRSSESFKNWQHNASLEVGVEGNLKTAWLCKSLLKMQFNSKIFNPSSERLVSSALHYGASRSRMILLWEGSQAASVLRQEVHSWEWSIVLKTEEMGKAQLLIERRAPKCQPSSCPWLIDFEQLFFSFREEIRYILWKIWPALEDNSVFPNENLLQTPCD